MDRYMSACLRVLEIDQKVSATLNRYERIISGAEKKTNKEQAAKRGGGAGSRKNLQWGLGKLIDEKQ